MIHNSLYLYQISCVYCQHLFLGRYNDLLDSLEFRRAERDRIRSHVAKCSADTNLVGGGVDLIQKYRKSEHINVFWKHGQNLYHDNRLSLISCIP